MLVHEHFSVRGKFMFSEEKGGVGDCEREEKNGNSVMPIKRDHESFKKVKRSILIHFILFWFISLENKATSH